MNNDPTTYHGYKIERESEAVCLIWLGGALVGEPLRQRWQPDWLTS